MASRRIECGQRSFQRARAPTTPRAAVIIPNVDVAKEAGEALCVAAGPAAVPLAVPDAEAVPFVPAPAPPVLVASGGGAAMHEFQSQSTNN